MTQHGRVLQDERLECLPMKSLSSTIPDDTGEPILCPNSCVEGWIMHLLSVTDEWSSMDMGEFNAR